MGEEHYSLSEQSDIDILRNALEHGWDADTSVYDSGEWTEDNPAYGQCAASACVVQDYLGGEIVNVDYELPDGETESHYFNDIDGVVVDFTEQQFPDEAERVRGTEKREEFETTREYVLSYDPTVKRYELLSERVTRFLQEHV